MTTVCAEERRPGVSAVEWRPQEGMSFAEWLEQGRRLGQVGRSVGWWIGDWLRFGNFAYGERYVRASRVTGYDVQTLKNLVYVAAHVEPSRRRDALSWSHHAEVVALEAAEQERWLDRAEQERLSVRCLREEIRREARAEKAAESEPPAAGGHDPGVVCPSCGHAFQPDGEPALTVAA
jgi:hypothetical protein